MCGQLVILSGPSGVGKDTVLDTWREANPRVQRVVAYTTRSPRPGEVDGIDYHFIDRHRFADMIKSGAFLEHKVVFGNGYATPLQGMEALLNEDKIAILKIDVQGAMTAMHLRRDALSIFLLPPSTAELERRIRGRATDDAEEIERRLATALHEISLSVRYGYQIVNDDLKKTVRALEEIVRTRIAETT